MLTIYKQLQERSEKSKPVTENHNDDALYYHTFAITGAHSQAIASDVDGTPPDLKYAIQTNDRGMKFITR